MNCMKGPFNVDDSDIESSASSNLSYPVSANIHTDSHSDENNNNDIHESRDVGELEQMKLFAAVETARVNRWKLFVILSILVVGGAVSTCTFITLSNEQSADAFDAVSLLYCWMCKFPNQLSNLLLYKICCSLICLPTRSKIHLHFASR